LTPHCRQHCAGHAENTEDVHIEQRLGLANRGFLRAAQQANAGVIDKQVNAPGFGQHLFDQLRHGCIIRHVAGQHGYAVGPFGRGVTAGTEYAKSSIVQGTGRGLPDAGGRSRHQRDAEIGLVHGTHAFPVGGVMDRVLFVSGCPLPLLIPVSLPDCAP
jgi:hypothetical protein